MLLFCAALLGYCYAAWMAQQRLADALPEEWQGKNIVVTGIVAEMPRTHERGLRFVFDVENVQTPQAHVPQRILLSTYDGNGNAPLMPAAGERWQFTVRLKQPHGSSNPYSTDFEVWALERDIRAVGYVHAKGDNLSLSQQTVSPAYLVQHLRETVRTHFQKTLGEAPYTGILTALAIGDQSGIAQDEWQLFTRTGTNHLMSISGLHITLLAGMIFALVYWLWQRSVRLTLWFPARKAAALAGLCAALFYTLISGYEVPAQRTLYMVATFTAMLLLSRNVSPSQMLAAALMVVLLADPWAVLSPGFWLSFGAVALIFYVTANRLRKHNWLVEYGKVQWAMTIGLIPPLLALFQQLSLVAPLANAFAIPLVSFLVVPLTLLGTLPPFEWMLYLAHQALALCMFLLGLLDKLPYAVWVQHAPPAWTVIAGIAGALWMLAPRGFPMRWLGSLLLLPMFLIAPPTPARGFGAHHRVRCRTRPVGRGADARTCPALRHRAGLLRRSGQRKPHPAARPARHGHQATGRAGAVAWRYGPHRRHDIGAAGAAGDEGPVARCRPRIPDCDSPPTAKPAPMAADGSGTACASRYCIPPRLQPAQP